MSATANSSGLGRSAIYEVDSLGRMLFAWSAGQPMGLARSRLSWCAQSAGSDCGDQPAGCRSRGTEIRAGRNKRCPTASRPPCGWIKPS